MSGIKKLVAQRVVAILDQDNVKKLLRDKSHKESFEITVSVSRANVKIDSGIVKERKPKKNNFGAETIMRSELKRIMEK